MKKEVKALNAKAILRQAAPQVTPGRPNRAKVKEFIQKVKQVELQAANRIVM